MIFETGKNKCNIKSFTVKHCVLEKEIDDFIVHTKFAIFLVSSQFFNTIIYKRLQPLQNRFMVTNESLLKI